MEPARNAVDLSVTEPVLVPVEPPTAEPPPAPSSWVAFGLGLGTVVLAAVWFVAHGAGPHGAGPHGEGPAVPRSVTAPPPPTPQARRTATPPA